MACLLADTVIDCHSPVLYCRGCTWRLCTHTPVSTTFIQGGFHIGRYYILMLGLNQGLLPTQSTLGGVSR